MNSFIRDPRDLGTQHERLDALHFARCAPTNGAPLSDESTLYLDCLAKLSRATETLSQVALALDASLGGARSGLMSENGTFEPPCDALLPLKLALCLPELGGKLSRNSSENVPSPIFGLKSLRAAIQREELVGFRQRARIYVTRQAIRDWIARCRVTSKNLTLSSENCDVTKSPVASLTQPLGSSKTVHGKSAQDAVSMILTELGAPCTNTTSRNMRPRP